MAERDFDLRILKARSHYLAVVRSPDGEEALVISSFPSHPSVWMSYFADWAIPAR